VSAAILDLGRYAGYYSGFAGDTPPLQQLCGRHGRLYNRSVIKKRPPRLQQIFQSYDPPLFFVTICTAHRRKIDRLETAHEAFRKYALKG